MAAEPPSANTNSAIDSGRIVLPVCSASKPSTVCRYSGSTKKVAWMMNAWHAWIVRPGLHPRDLEQREVEQRVLAARLDPSSHAAKAYSRTAPMTISHSVGDSPSGVSGRR